MKDRFILGCTAGFIGSVISGIFNILFNMLPGVNVKTLSGMSTMFIPNVLRGTYQGNFIGAIAAIICGTVLGIGFLYIFDKTGYGNPLVKGALLGLMSWFVLCGILNQGLSLGMEDNLTDSVVAIINRTIFGMTTAWVIYKYRTLESLTGEIL